MRVRRGGAFSRQLFVRRHLLLVWEVLNCVGSHQLFIVFKESGQVFLKPGRVL